MHSLEFSLYLLQCLSFGLRQQEVGKGHGRGGETRKCPECRDLTHLILHCRKEFGNDKHQAPVYHNGHTAGDAFGFRWENLAYYRERYGTVTNREDDVEQS